MTFFLVRLMLYVLLLENLRFDIAEDFFQNVLHSQVFKRRNVESSEIDASTPELDALLNDPARVS